MWTILIDQDKLLAAGIDPAVVDMNDLAVLSYIFYKGGTAVGRQTAIEVPDEGLYIRLPNAEVMAELPYIGQIKKDTLYRRYMALVRAGLLKAHPHVKRLGAPYYALTPKGESAFHGIKNSDTIGKNTDTIGKNTDTIGKNSDTIGKNSDTIGKNSDTIGKNTDTIGKNTDNIGKNTDEKSNFLTDTFNINIDIDNRYIDTTGKSVFELEDGKTEKAPPVAPPPPGDFPGFNEWLTELATLPISDTRLIDILNRVYADGEVYTRQFGTDEARRHSPRQIIQAACLFVRYLETHAKGATPKMRMDHLIQRRADTTRKGFETFLAQHNFRNDPPSADLSKTNSNGGQSNAGRRRSQAEIIRDRVTRQ